MVAIDKIELNVLEEDTLPSMWANTPVLISVVSDDGLRGNFLTWFGNPSTVIGGVKQLQSAVLGRNPWNVEKINKDLFSLGFDIILPYLEMNALSGIDIAIWDLLGKIAGQPTYRLLGGKHHEEVPVVGTGVFHDSTEDYVQEALDLKEQGFSAYKLEATPDKDVAACPPPKVASEAVREAVGDEMDLMIDIGFGCTNKVGKAVDIGRKLEELDFTWYEGPINGHDIQGYVRLNETLDIPLALEILTHSSAYIDNRAVDIFRGMCDGMGGITKVKKLASTCESFGLNMEPHSFGPPHTQAANLHVLLSIPNCSYFEVPIPRDELDPEIGDTLEVENGHVQPPEKPGLGLDIDYDKVSDITVRKEEIQ